MPRHLSAQVRGFHPTSVQTHPPTSVAMQTGGSVHWYRNTNEPLYWCIQAPFLLVHAGTIIPRYQTLGSEVVTIGLTDRHSVLALFPRLCSHFRERHPDRERDVPDRGRGGGGSHSSGDEHRLPPNGFPPALLVPVQ